MAVLLILMIMNIDDPNAHYTYEGQRWEIGLTIEECMALAADINGSAPIAVGNVTAVCLPQLYEIKESTGT